MGFAPEGSDFSDMLIDFLGARNAAGLSLGQFSGSCIQHCQRCNSCPKVSGRRSEELFETPAKVVGAVEPPRIRDVRDRPSRTRWVKQVDPAAFESLLENEIRNRVSFSVEGHMEVPLCAARCRSELRERQLGIGKMAGDIEFDAIAQCRLRVTRRTVSRKIEKRKTHHLNHNVRHFMAGPVRYVRYLIEGVGNQIPNQLAQSRTPRHAARDQVAKIEVPSDESVAWYQQQEHLGAPRNRHPVRLRRIVDAPFARPEVDRPTVLLNGAATPRYQDCLHQVPVVMARQMRRSDCPMWSSANEPREN
ncbi:MAG TPA: hypothetical protein VEJ38_07920 [Candidatus Acidoferrales bacterium]|nr:hypothetical protein [Candidatus Acidoferrales bacterium]